MLRGGRIYADLLQTCSAMEGNIAVKALDIEPRLYIVMLCLSLIVFE